MKDTASGPSGFKRTSTFISTAADPCSEMGRPMNVSTVRYALPSANRTLPVFGTPPSNRSNVVP